MLREYLAAHGDSLAVAVNQDIALAFSSRASDSRALACWECEKCLMHFLK